MPTWSDDFSVDHFGDSYYTLVGGVEGTDFNVSGGALNVLHAMSWRDTHHNGAFIDMHLTVADVSLPLYIATLGLIDVVAAVGYEAQVILNNRSGVGDAAQGLVAYVAPGGGPVTNSGSFVGSTDTGIYVCHFTATATEVTLDIGGNVITLAVPPDVSAALTATSATLTPFAGLTGLDSAYFPVSHWDYTVSSPGGGGPSAPPGLIVVGQHHIGVV